MKTKNFVGIDHKIFGRYAAPEPGTVFNPLAVFLDPAALPKLLRYWEYRAARFGVGSGLPKHLRAAAIAQAGQDTLQVFLDRDYEGDGITASEVVRAILGAARWMERSQYRLSQIGDGARRRDTRKWFPYNRAQNAKTQNPAAIVATTMNAAEDREALIGTGSDDMPGDTIHVPGGPGGRGVTDGKIVRTERIVREWVESLPMIEFETLSTGGGLSEPQPIPFQEIETGWKMERKRGKARTYKAATVSRGKRAPRNRFTPPPATLQTRKRESGERCGMLNYAPDVDAYRGALAEYYASK